MCHTKMVWDGGGGGNSTFSKNSDSEMILSNFKQIQRMFMKNFVFQITHFTDEFNIVRVGKSTQKKTKKISSG